MPITHFPPPPNVKAPPLSYAARVGDLLFVSGIPGFDDTGKLPDAFEAQFGFVAATIKRMLAEAGTDTGRLARANVPLIASAITAAAVLSGHGRL